MELTDATNPPARSRLARRRVLLCVLAAYLALWVLLAIAPVDRSDWLLENLLVFTVGVGLALLWRRLQLSDVSCILIALFLALHAIGAHYTYSKVPFGFWMQDALDLERNHFDRIVHAGFGLLLVYPTWELMIRSTRFRGALAWFTVVCTIFAMSSLFELVEAGVAMMVSPELGAAYLGTQGDEWDAQKDMALALVGGIAAMAITIGAKKAGLGRSR